MSVTLKSVWMSVATLIAVLATTLLFKPTPVLAAEEDTDPVFIFNRICYAQVPKLNSIRAMSQRLAWKPITGEDLSRFTTIESPDVLEGWDVQVGIRLFRVAIVQSKMSATMEKTFPDLKGGTATSCMIILDEQNPAQYVNANMQKLAGKTPVSKDVADGEFSTTTWAGGNNELKVFLISKTNKNGQGGLLNVTILTKPGATIE